MKTKKIIALLVAVSIMLPVVGFMPTTVAAASSYSREQYYLDSIIEYSQFSDSDPQYITDEDFFGVWDESSEQWIDEPMFDYFRFPKMEAVENAAKLGDYETCKEALLEYYREKHDGYFINGEAGVTELSSQERAQYESVFDNFIRAGYVVIAGKMHFQKNDSWDNADVTAVLKSIATGSGSNKTMKFLLACGKKDGYRIELEKLGEYRPYVVAVINGEQRKIYADVATYVDGGEPDASHNEEEKLLVEESVTSIGNVDTVDENTKNAFLQFDFSGLSSTDQIESASLYLYGRFTDDDVSAEPRLENVSFKSLYLVRWTGTNVIDKNITWNKYRAQTIHYYSYDGEPTKRVTTNPAAPNGLRGPSNPTPYVTFAADGYHATLDEAFAFHAIRHLVQYSIDKGGYDQMMADYKKGFYEALELAGYGYGSLWQVDKVIDSKYMTPEAYTIIMKQSYMMGRWGTENWPKHFESNNHGSYGVNGLESICFLYPEFAPVDDPLKTNEDGSLYYMDETLSGSVTGGWLAVANYRRAVKAKADVMYDGASIEGSTSYALDGLSNYLDALTYGERVGIDNSYCYTDEEANSKIEQGLMYVISKLNPMLGDFQVGDGKGWKEHSSSLFKPYLQIIDNDYLRYVVSDRNEGKEPPFLTCAYDSMATAVFRNAWVDDYSIAAHFEARGGGSHNHNDDGNIVLFAYGNYLLVDPRQGDYNEEDPYERWVSSSRGHNTVEINNAVGRGYRTYTTQQEPLVFEYDEDGNPKVDENGVVMMDDPLIVPISQLDYRPGYLYPEDREINTVYDYMRADSLMFKDNNASTLKNEDFSYERDVLFLRSGYFIVVDTLSPEYGDKNGSNHYKQQWHFLPDANISVDNDKNTIRTNFNGRADIIVATVDNNETMTAQYKYGLYAAERSVFGTVKYGTFEQDKVGTATFNTLLYPVRQDKDANVTTTKILLDLEDDEANAFRATVVDTETNVKKDIYFYTLFDYDKKKPMVFGSYETDATLALGDKEDNNYSNAVIRNGKYLKNIIDNEYVIYSEEEISDIGVYWQNDEIDIAYNEEDEYNFEIDFDKLTIKANGKAKIVRINGEEVEFNQKGRYVYFGDSPILDDEEILPDPDENETPGNTNPDHGTGGAGSSGSSSSGESSGGSSSGGSSEDLNNEKEDASTTEEKPSDSFKNELSGHWAENEISSLVDSGIIQGSGNGLLNLDNSITRAEFITMLVRALGIEPAEYNNSFNDVSNDKWYASYVETALQSGWIQGDGNNFYPDKNISREEITKILVSAFEQKFGDIDIDNEISFDDKGEISIWAESFVNKAVSVGLINGMGDNKFMPKENAKREQAMVLIYRFINNKK